MSEVQALVEGHLVACIQDSLAHYVYDNARWLAERLVAQSASEFNLHLLAVCYFQANQVYRAYHVLKGHCSSPHVRYFFAVCCTKLNKLQEAQDMLTKQGLQQVPGGASGLYLLARVCRMTGNLKEAKDYFVQALRINPLIWSAYEELCALGADDEAHELCARAFACQAQTCSEGARAAANQQDVSNVEPLQARMSQQAAHMKGGLQGSSPKPSSGPVAVKPNAASTQAAGTNNKGCLSPRHHHLMGNAFLTSLQAPDTATPGFPIPAGAAFNATAAAAGQGSLLTQAGAERGGMQLFDTASTKTDDTSSDMAGCRRPQGGWQGSAMSWDTPLPAPSFATPSNTSLVPAGCSSAQQMAGSMSTSPPAPADHTSCQAPSLGDSPPVSAPLFWAGGHCHQPQFTVTPAAASLLASTPSTETNSEVRTGPPKSMMGLTGRGMLMYTGAMGTPETLMSSGTQQGLASVPVPGSVTDSEGGRYSTPSPGPEPAAPPGPPRKLSQDEGMFPGFAHDVAHNGASTPSSGYGAAFSGPNPVPRRDRIATDDGKLRKVCGKSLFHEGTSSPGTGMRGMPGPSPSRRSSRLAALANGGVGPGGGRGGGRGGGGNRYHHQHQSQNRPDPSDLPASPSQQQAHTHAKLAAEGSPVKRGPGANIRLQTGPLRCGPVMGGSIAAMMTGVANGPAQDATLALLCHIYDGYRHLAMFRTADALAAFNRLATPQHRTAWVHCCVGKLLMERMEYHQAAAAFEAACQFDRQRVEGLELYSTVLWHLRRDTDLCFLAQTALAIDRLAPQTWCVVGNLLSLHKEHDTALKLFDRALQLDPSFTYAHTLSGHEYAAGEELDKALTCYRQALRTDPRHYNAMYGMGVVYFRQEKYDVALCHFKSAATVNPRSSVLHCYCGMALARQNIHSNALTTLQVAIELDPRNPLARYERAALLVSQDCLEEALKEYKALAHLAPGEASVYLQMGKLYKRLNMLGAAQQQLELALSFNTASTESAAIKAAIDKLSISEEAQEEEM